MGVLARLLSPPQYTARSAVDDYWYTAIGEKTATGVTVTPETALNVSTVWACVRLIAESLASLPLITYRYRANGDRERAVGNSLYDLLHNRPNAEQTAFEFVEMLTTHALLRGGGYSAILPSTTNPIGELIPLDPDRIKLEKIRLGRDGPNGLEVIGKRYRYRQLDRTEVVLSDEDVFHLRGLSLDGFNGVSTVTYARESIGLAMATEEYGARWFGSGSTPRGILQAKGTLSKEATTRLRKEWQTLHGGLKNSHAVGVLEEGVEWKGIGISPEDSQFLATREFQVSDIARWFRVPPHMVGHTTKETSWGSGIEQLSLGFVIYTLLPWMRRWESAVRRDLILQPNTFFVEFLVDGLLRGNQKDRYDAYAVGRQWGWLSVNDIRRLENQDAVDGGDVRLQPLNMAPLGTITPPAAQLGAGHYHLLVQDAAARIVRKEIVALSKAAKRCANDADAWRQAVEEFYADHAEHVAQTLRVPLVQAQLYVAEQRRALVEHGAAVMAGWETVRVADLVQIALEESNADASTHA